MFYKNLLLYFVPAFLIITGFVCERVKDKKINDKYGYRSALSMKNKANWYYANDKMSKLCFILGAVFLLVGFLVQKYLEITTVRIIIILIVEVFFYITSGILLENKLKEAHKK